MSDHKYDCPMMMDLLVDYLEEGLDDEARERLEFHLELCPPCMNFLETYRQTGHVCRDVLARKMPRELKSSLRDFLSHECSAKKKEP